MTILDEEARAGFPRMRGARVSATIPVSQDLVDGMLSNLPVRVEIHENNRISVSYRAIQAAAEIVRVTPELTIVISTSWISRMALRGVLALKPRLQAYLSQQDRFVYVSCGRIPVLAKYRYLWQHLSEIRARTERGRLVLNLEAQIR